MLSATSQPQPQPEFDDLDLASVRGTLRAMIHDFRADPALREICTALETAGINTSEGKIRELEEAVDSKGALPDSLVRVIISKKGRARDRFAVIEKSDNQA